jgi:hypothetical protein
VIPTYGTTTGAPRVHSRTSDCADVVRELPRWLKRVPRIEASRLGDAGVVTGAVRRALDQAHGEIRATLV